MTSETALCDTPAARATSVAVVGVAPGWDALADATPGALVAGRVVDRCLGTRLPYPSYV
jgi:hypothetical protein